MEDHGGVGLAAIQMNVSYRVFAMKIGSKVSFHYNPKVVHFSEEVLTFEEGCLSFPGLLFKVKRPAHVEVEYQDRNGVVHNEQLTGLAARCFQHELDHLDGVCFVDRVSKLTLEMAKKKRLKRERKN